MPSGPARYQSYPSHLQRTSVPPEAYTPSMDSNAAKEQSRDGGKNRGGLPKHMQEQHMGKSEPKLSSPVPGGLYPGTYPPPSSRSQHLLPPQSETPPSRGESGTPSREKTQNKPMSIQDPEHRALGKTSMINFINIIVIPHEGLLPSVPLIWRCLDLRVNGHPGPHLSPSVVAIYITRLDPDVLGINVLEDVFVPAFMVLGVL